MRFPRRISTLFTAFACPTSSFSSWMLTSTPKRSTTSLNASFSVSSSSSSSSATPSSSSYSTTTTTTSFKVLGVCGGIGSGKSSASKLLVSELGCLAHLDADSIAHSVYAPGSQAVQDIVAEFGNQVLLSSSQSLSSQSSQSSSTEDEEMSIMEIDRKALGAIVFGDPKDMAKLERLVWPHVKQLLQHEIHKIKTDWDQLQEEKVVKGEEEREKEKDELVLSSTKKIPVVVLEAAMLLDAEWNDILDGVWVVKTHRDVALQRLMETRGLTEMEANKRIDAQQSRRGIGNLQDELEKRIVTNVVENSGTVEDLIESLQVALCDPKSWK